MAKSPIFWSGVCTSLVIMAGTLFVPILVGNEFAPGSLYVVVPIAVLVAYIVQLVLDSVFGVKSRKFPFVKIIVDGYAGMFAGFVFGVLCAMVFLLPF